MIKPCISFSIYDKKTANYLRFYAGGSIQFNFAYISDRINNIRNGKIKFDTLTLDSMHNTCLKSVNFERDCLKITVYTDIYMHMQMVTHYLF